MNMNSVLMADLANSFWGGREFLKWRYERNDTNARLSFGLSMDRFGNVHTIFVNIIGCKSESLSPTQTMVGGEDYLGSVFTEVAELKLAHR